MKLVHEVKMEVDSRDEARHTDMTIDVMKSVGSKAYHRLVMIEFKHAGVQGILNTQV